MKHIIALLIAVAAGFLTYSCNAKNTIEKKEKQPYNVLFIAIDDLNDFTGFLGGHPQTQTPNMDKLASEGVVFEKAYCAASVCNPSRAALMAGFSPSTTGIYGNSDYRRNSELLKDMVTIPQDF